MKKYFVVLMVVCLSMGLLLAGCKKGSSNDSSEVKGSGYSENRQANNGAPVSPAEDPELQVITDDTIVRQIINVDGDLTMFEETGINEIYLTNGGKLSLMTYGDLQANEGAEAVIAEDAAIFDILHYGNGGYRVVVFVRKDGTVSIVDPDILIQEHRIEIIDNLGDLTDIIGVYEQDEEDGTVIVAMDKNGDVTVLDEYLYE